MSLWYTVNSIDATNVLESSMDLKLTDAGAERAVLAGLFSYGLESYVEVSTIIDAKTFGNHNNQVLYKCVEKVFQSEAEIDLPAILSAVPPAMIYAVVGSVPTINVQ